MITECTLSIVKPDAVERNLIGAIYQRIEAVGLRLIAVKMLHLSEEQAKGFYAEHEGKHFYADLITFMTSGPIIVQVLEGEAAIDRYRELMGKVNPDEAAYGTIRSDYAINICVNSVHGSDSQIAAKREIAYFFSEDEIYPRKS
ncbi:nucleoside-diphosphate kinase [Candidatus Enterovibrio escicola]|uniref:nucleoside-diphosphate kinase n=1 Tax=Candidatus Enterovibrio escicola TaxID=1927127 RepID=UPI001237F2D0|nr:nucleoside-diphosphate kinase [Candidatus Enterovibrio escacola]